MMNVDWEFELEKTVGAANNKAVTDVMQLSTDAHLSHLMYDPPDGLEQRIKLPDEWEADGECQLIVDGLPVELTDLGNGKVEVYWPVGMHDHASEEV